MFAQLTSNDDGGKLQPLSTFDDIVEKIAELQMARSH